MKITLIFLLASLPIYSAITQDFKIQTGASFTKNHENELYHIAFPSAYGFMTYSYLDNMHRDYLKAIELTKYNQSMQVIGSQRFNLPKLGQRVADLMKVIELKNKLIFISQSMESKIGKHQIYAQVYSEKDNSVSERQILASFPIASYSKSGRYQVVASPDKATIAIFANMPFEKKTREKVKVWVFDMNFNLLWEQNETLNFDSEKAYQEEVFVTNGGDVYLNKVTDFYKKTRETLLLKFDGVSVETTVFSSDGFQPLNKKLINVNTKPMLIGFFWDGDGPVMQVNSKEGNANDGVFLYDLQAMKLTGKHDWSDTLDVQNLRGLVVADCKFVGDDIFLFGERRLIRSEFRKEDSELTSKMDYFSTFGHSIMTNLDSRGTLKGYQPLIKSKEYKNAFKERGSFRILCLKNGLYIFSNDDRLNGASLFKVGNRKYHQPSLVSISSSTKTKYIIPNTIREVEGYNLVYFMTTFGNQYWLGRMSW